MKSNKIAFILGTLLSLNLSQKIYAHEGHDQVPGAITANHGGTVKAGKQFNLEYVFSGTELKLFPVSHEGKDLDVNNVKLTATTKSPKTKTENIKLEQKENMYTSTVDFKNAYRIEVLVNAEEKGKKSTFKIQLEK